MIERRDRAPGRLHHRMFCHITANWRGRPLTSYQVVLETIAATTTRTGLAIGAELDTGSYDLGISVTPAEFHALPITPNAFHGDWNYTLCPSPRSVETMTAGEVGSHGGEATEVRAGVP